MSEIHEAIRRGDLKAIQVAIASDADLDEWDDDCLTPLQVACDLGHVEIVQLLLDAGVGAGEALNGAIRGHHSNIARLFLERGLDPNQVTDEEGATHLSFAAAVGDLETVKVLVEAGADVNVLTRDRESPLSVAHHNGHEHVVAYLLPLCSERVRDLAGY